MPAPKLMVCFLFTAETFDTRQLDAPATLKVAGKRRSASRAVAFPGDVGGRLFSLVLGNVIPDEFSDRLRVFFQSVEQRGCRGALRPAKSSADRVDEHQIRHVQNRAIVLYHLRWTRGIQAVVADQDAARTEEPKVHVSRRGPGAAVEAKREAAAGRAFTRLFGVSDIENVRLGFAGPIRRGKHAGRGRVLDFLSGNDD